ncbi:MAG: protein translocase subunit SecF [Cellvibrionaceae bacterium]
MTNETEALNETAIDEVSNNNVRFDFMGRRKIAAVFSIILLIVSIAALVTKGLNLGLDFLGGTQVEVTFEESADLDKARDVLTAEGFKDAAVVYFGTETEVMIRFHGSLEDVAVERINQSLASVDPEATIVEVGKRSSDYESKVSIAGADSIASHVSTLFPAELYGGVRIETEKNGDVAFLTNTSLSDAMSKSMLIALSKSAGSEVVLNYSESVDSQVGSEMFENAMIGLLVALSIVMVYVALRFQYKFSLGAVAALIHDVVITLGLFALFGWDFDLTVFAAVLAVIGYSLNDTIVVSDRIRENFRLVRQSSPTEIINVSLNQTLGRTLVTSLTTLLVLAALFLFGGEVIHGFSQALIVGVTIGTYSSIYVAANIMLALHISKEDLIVPIKEGAEFDETP